MSNATQSLAGTRITSLLDANSFVEIGQSVTARNTDFNMTEKKAPSDGVITGYGVIDGNLVYVYSQDVSVLNGTVGEMHAKKITRLYDMAMKTGAPVIGLIDCAGLRLQEATDALEAFQSEETGLVDGIGTEDEILGKIRELVTYLPSNCEDTDSYMECTDDLNRVCEDIENCTGDTAIALSRIADKGQFFEVKADYGKSVAVGFIRLNGATVGAVANRSESYDAEGKKVWESDGTLSARGARKAAEFVKFCDAFEIPVLTLTNVNGFKATVCGEKMMAKSVGALVHAFADATVPKVNVVIGKAFGTAYTAMNSKAIGADMVYAWENAEIGMMDADLAAKIMYAGDDAAALTEKAAEYRELQNSVSSAAARGYVDTIISPADTRKYVIGAFEMLFTKREERPSKKHGTV